MFHNKFWVTNDDEQLYSNSSGGQGFGVYFSGHWAYSAWPEAWCLEGITSGITVLELFPILVCLHLWGSDLSRIKIRFMCDNKAVVDIINSMTSKSDRVMVILRHITLVCLRQCIARWACHIPGTANCLGNRWTNFGLMHRKRTQAPSWCQTFFSRFGTGSKSIVGCQFST